MIIARKVEKQYGNFTLRADFEIPSGYVTGFVGKNGAGKSTVIKAILGLIRPDSGEITVMGTKSTELGISDKQKIGAALAESGFSPYLRGCDILAILRKAYPSFAEEKFRRECERMGIPLDKPLKEFSTGMKAKLRVLTALTHNAKLLIMDEPTAGLDVEARGTILDMIREYMTEDESRTVLLTSHISSDLESICDDIYLIHNGEILFHEDTDVILGEYGLLKVDRDTYRTLDKSHLLKSVPTEYGYSCFTGEKQYYLDNYPGITVENGSIDELILMLTGGEQ